jgi:hypothetical protein
MDFYQVAVYNNNTHHTNNTPHSNKHSTQNYTNSKGHTTHTEYNTNTITPSSWVHVFASCVTNYHIMKRVTEQSVDDTSGCDSR